MPPWERPSASSPERGGCLGQATGTASLRRRTPRSVLAWHLDQAEVGVDLALVEVDAQVLDLVERNEAAEAGRLADRVDERDVAATVVGRDLGPLAGQPAQAELAQLQRDQLAVDLGRREP